MEPMELKATVTSIAKATEKLLFETERLHRDVVKLCGRIEPFENEQKFTDPSPSTAQVTLPEVFGNIIAACNSIRACEYHLSSIRGRIDAIESDAVSREEMKPWLKR